MFPQLARPIVQAPMAGGPSTPALAREVGEAGGLGFLAAGYQSPEALAGEMAAMGSVPFGVNVFAPVAGPADERVLAAYARELRADAEALGGEVGAARFDDDAFDAKVALLLERAPAVVSFSFGCPSAELVRALQGRGVSVWVTSTTPDEAVRAAGAGADAVVAQGAEAGGHRGGFADIEDVEPLTTMVLLQLLAAADLGVPVVAAGGIASAPATAAALGLGARAVAAGTAFMCCPEAGTAALHRAALGTRRGTVLTRAFSGRLARALENDFLRAHSAHAPAAYPQVHHLTSPIRAAARAAGDVERVNLWAGQTHGLVAHDRPAAEVVRTLAPGG